LIDYNTVFSSVLSNLWPFLILAFIVAFFKSPWMKGKIGEGIINTSNRLLLDKEVYTPVKNITLQLSDGSTTQIDHILISQYGIFVIETKNMKGWIFGGEHQKRWTQQIYREKKQFQSPLQQNYRHIKALEEVLELPLSAFTSIIAFVGECEFKTQMPENVFQGLSYTKYIKSFKQERLSPQQIQKVLNILQNRQLKKSFKTDRQHVNNLKERHTNRAPQNNNQTCSRCGSIMVKRTNKKNGESFLGCSNFPKCKNTISIK
jgi:restriction system protein